MKIVPAKLRAAITVLLLTVCAIAMTTPAPGMAQSDPADGPPIAMGAGRMVRGTVTAVAADKLTIKTQEGTAYQVAITPNTQIRQGRAQLKLAEVHVGDGIGAVGEIDQPTRTVHALFIAIVSAEDLRKAREAMGKTFISGTVQAIDETRITVLRTDQVTQVIQVDEDTSFRRGVRGMQFALGNSDISPRLGAGPGAQGPQAQAGESITLADIKVGDVIAGPGALKAGIFTPTQLAVSDPAAQRQRRRPAADDPTRPATPPTGPHP